MATLSISELPYSYEIFAEKLGYGDITGSERLKEQIQSLYDLKQEITVTHGAIGANQLVFLSLLEKGDEVISIVPTYQQHYSIPESLGCNIKLYFLKEENKWLPDINELKEIITPNTKLLCLNNPNNPTGAVIPDDMLEEIVEICKTNGTWILSDEVYRGLNLVENPYSKSIADIYNKGISVGSMSKTYSLPGLRVGWICTQDKDLINEINHQRQYNTISISALDDYFASVAIEHRDFIQERNFRIMHKGVNILKTWIKNTKGVSCVIPNGGTTALIRYYKDISSREFCKDLQDKTGVAVVPSEVFELENHFRIGFCAEHLYNALELIKQYISLVL